MSVPVSLTRGTRVGCSGPRLITGPSRLPPKVGGKEKTASQVTSLPEVPPLAGF